MLSAAAVCVSVEFFLITSQRSPTVVRQKERGAGMRGSEIEGGKDGKEDRMLTGTGRQNYTVKTERVKGNKVEAKRRCLLEIFRLASVCHADCHFGSGKQVEHLHLQCSIFKNAWSHCPKNIQSNGIIRYV